MKTEKRISNYAAAPAQRGAARKTTAKGARQAASKAYARLSAGELRTLVAAAQRFDDEAIAKLCAAFEPLVYKEAHNSKIISFLKEDALNTAWEIFLDYIHKFNQQNYKKLPSLLQLNIRYELLHRIYRSKSVEVTPILDEVDGDADRKLELSDQNSCITTLDNKVLAVSLLDRLSLGQKKVIQDTVINGLTLEEYSRANNITYTAAYRLRQRALSVMRQHLS